jgi:hypothetical protein
MLPDQVSVSNYLIAFAATVAVETAFWAATRSVRVLSSPHQDVVGYAIAANVFTHPIGWLVLWPALAAIAAPVPALLLLELWACVAEWLVLRRALAETPEGALGALVLAANGLSLLVGAAAQAAFE